MSSSANSSLRPAWRSGGRGFQPPPTVAASRNRSQSIGSTGEKPSATASQNKFAALDDDEDVLEQQQSQTTTPTISYASAANSQPPAPAVRAVSNTRSEGFRQGLAARQSSSGGGRPSGRSLADLAARVPERSSSFHGPHSSTRFSRSASTGGSIPAAAASAAAAADDPGKPVIRFTRERLLSMRPAPSDEFPAMLKHLEGSAIVSTEPQDPVCWDNFDAQEIWANVPATHSNRDRRISKAPSRNLGDMAHDDEGNLNSGGLGGRRVSTGGPGGGSRRDSVGSSAGRWRRGVALPPPSSSEKQGQSGGGGRAKDADNPNDLWDDPVTTAGAASDFSAFTMPDDDDPNNKSGVSPAADDAFDFDKMAEQSRLLEEEMHGTKRASATSSTGEGGSNGESSPGEDEGEDDDDQTQSRHIDPHRPLASIGTTIRSGSGDDVNVFEDFDEPDANNNSTDTPTATEADSSGAIKGLAEESASSRLMKAIGVNKTNTGDDLASAPTDTAIGRNPSMTNTPTTHSDGGGVAIPSPGSNNDGLSIPLNPWGGPLLPSQTSGGGEPSPQGLDLRARLRQADMEQKAREREAAEMLRRQQEMEAQKRAQQQQAALQQQQQQQQQGVQSQVELVLIERISTVLENSWGRADLMSILNTLHTEDRRVANLLQTVDALRALILRNPRRVAVRHDPAYGSEVAVLVVTNAQWQQQQQQQQQQQAQQQQQQAQARAQQEEMHRREQQRRMEEQKTREQQSMAPLVPGAPWYYSDPQRNIQGPFRGEEMRQWYDAGYFKGDLPISQEPTGPFRPLSTVFPDEKIAFSFPDDAAEKQQEAAAAHSKAAAEQEENERRSRAEAARRQAEAEAAERERLAREAEEERERLAAAAEEAQRRHAEEAAATAAAAKSNSKKKKNSDGGNESSAQLKMMLGLSAQGGGAGSGEPASGEAEQQKTKQAEPPAAASKRQSKASKSNTQQQTAAEIPEPTQSATRSPSNAAPSAPAWGGAAKPTSRKSMSEIQQEEARIAAVQAMQRKGSRSQSSGWANVASKGTPSTGPSAGWSGGGVKQAKVANVAAPTAIHTGRPSASGNVAAINKQTAANVSKPRNSAQGTTSSSVTDDFGAKMSPALEKWCTDQMVKLNGTDDLTLVAFCMTLQDPVEIRQYLTTYLGSTPQVNNFATEFINRKLGKPVQEEWETTASAKKKGKKKVGR